MANSPITKKRKHHENAQTNGGSSHKKAKKDKEKNVKRDEKGKGRAVEENADSAFRVVSASVVLSIPPVFARDLMKGVHEMLDSLIMRYVPALRGVVLSHANAAFISGNAKINAECPFAVCSVGFDATVWSPQVGSKLTGKIKLCSPDHIALLVLQTFNVSIPRHHIETENWEFQYGPLENDPEFGPFATSAEGEESDDAMQVDGSQPGEGEEQEVGGSWLHKLTGEKLGGEDGILEFTVIGLKIANQMLSLLGSLQDDPFSDRHIPQSAVSATAEEPEESEVEQNLAPLSAGSASSDDEFPDVPTISERTQEREETKEEKKRRKEEEKRVKELRRKEKEERRAAKEEKRKRKEEKKKRKEDEKALKKKVKGEKKVEVLISGKDES